MDQPQSAEGRALNEISQAIHSWVVDLENLSRDISDELFGASPKEPGLGPKGSCLFDAMLAFDVRLSVVAKRLHVIRERLRRRDENQKMRDIEEEPSPRRPQGLR